MVCKIPGACQKVRKGSRESRVITSLSFLERLDYLKLYLGYMDKDTRHDMTQTQRLGNSKRNRTRTRTQKGHS